MLLLMVGLGGWLSVQAEEPPKPAEPGTLVVLDSAGKEQKLKAWTFLTGTRALAWLAPDKPPEKKSDEEKEETKKPAGKRRPAEDEEAKPRGPLALVVRDETKIHFAEGVLTLVPLAQIRSIDFDNDKETMNVRVAVSDKPDADVVLTGTTAYKGINKLTLEADVDKGEAGVASLTYHGGVPKGIKGVRFPPPKVPAEEKGSRPATVVTADKDVKRNHQVSDLLALYRFGPAQERLLPTVMFKKTLKVDLNKVKKISVGTEESDDTVWQVMQKDGEESTLTLLPAITVDGHKGTLAGFVGRIPAGYKLFPIRRIVEVQFDSAAEKEKEIEKGKEKDREN
jgi:hypothetical protein